MNVKFSFILQILLILLFSSCEQREKRLNTVLEDIGTQSISVPEPSGIDITYDRSGFWTVSDENSTIYRLDNEGNVVQSIEVEGFDLEGITVIDEQKIAVVLERSREVVILDNNGNELQRKQLPLEGELNSGLEGISYNSENKHFYVLNEKNPSLLLELNQGLEIISMDTLDFSKDVSGIFYDEESKLFWIICDEDQFVAKVDLNSNLIDSIKVDIFQPEGITFDEVGKRLYIVSDSWETIHVFELK
ncbi:MAG: SdiA-regulated domain-containing protein [Ignavibacteria bacterium]|jgi:uncharacterized protein YjiK